VPHGTRVNAGDVLVELDTEKLDRAIADLDLDLAVGEKTLEIARRDLPVTEALQPLELAEAERDTLAATEDLARFLAIGRTLAEDSARFRLKASEEQLKYSREELRQLEKMYKDKDLTEETEEMILQRTRFEVESGEFNLRRAGIDTETALTFEVPRKEAALKDATEKAKLALEKTRATAGLALEQKRLALKKAERDRVEALRKMRDLQQDRAGIPLKAPRSGIVYYGRQHDGAWTTAAVAAKAGVKAAVTKKVMKPLEELGDIDELRQLKVDAERRRQEEQVKKGEFEKILQELAAKIYRLMSFESMKKAIIFPYSKLLQY
jgi:HlyD family secretion protein